MQFADGTHAPVKLQSVGSSTSNAKNLTAIKVCEGVAADSSAIFDGCTSLEYLDMQGMNYTSSSMTSLLLNHEALKTVLMPSLKNVNNITYLFKGCKNLETVVFTSAGIAAPKLEQMMDVFTGCDNLKEVDLSPLDMSEVYSASYLFMNCPKLETVNLGNMGKNASQNEQYVTGTMTTTMCMFQGCTNLQTIYAEQAIKASSSNSMFSGCEKLKAYETTFNPDKHTAEYARIDGENGPGYFMYKPAVTDPSEWQAHELENGVIALYG